jgi:hypothetical protein
MQTTRRSCLKIATRVFQTATTAVAGLYLTTHSVAITAIGTSAAGVITAWVIWLDRRTRGPAPRG